MCDGSIKIAPVKKVRVLLYCLLGLVLLQQVFAGKVFASVTQVERAEEELLILELYVNGKLRNHGLLGYLPKGSDLNQTLLPLFFPIPCFKFFLQKWIRQRDLPMDGFIRNVIYFIWIWSETMFLLTDGNDLWLRVLRRRILKIYMYTKKFWKIGLVSIFSSTSVHYGCT